MRIAGGWGLAGRLFAIGFAASWVGSVVAAPNGSKDEEWPVTGRDASEQRFSPLTQINDKNVDRLGLAWSLDLPGEVILEATPLEVGGVLFFTGGFGNVYAVEAINGKLLWKFNPHEVATDSSAAARIYGVNRGAAYWDGKVYSGTRDGRMLALDAKTGKVVWETKFLIPGTHSTSTGAPRVFKGRILIGNSGADMGGRGYVTAMDGKTGAIVWRWFVVPGDPNKPFEDESMERAAKTWGGEWWKRGGGGNSWSGMTYDADYNQVLIGTGNGGPWNCHQRAPEGKDNLYLASVVALDADTGKYKWHYQYNPRECWDWKATQEIILATLPIDGKPTKVMLQVPTNGFFYVIDRSNGKLLSAEKVGKATWADRIDLATGRPVERPGIRYENGGPVTIYPTMGGLHNWQQASFNPMTGLEYIPSWQMGFTWQATSVDLELLDRDPGKTRNRYGVGGTPYMDPDDQLDGHGFLVAWDPVQGKVRWRAQHYLPNVGGTATTAGNLVFNSFPGGFLYAYDATTGERLWEYDAKVGIIASPITYSVKGRQYVSVLAGPGGMYGEGGFPGMNMGWKWGLHPRRLLTFALDAHARLPKTPLPDYDVYPVDDPSIAVDPQRAAAGEIVYHWVCTFCHGAEAASRGNAPDLRESNASLNRDSFRSIVTGGAMMESGMPKMDLTDEEVEDLFQYIRRQARKAKAAQAQ